MAKFYKFRGGSANTIDNILIDENDRNILNNEFLHVKSNRSDTPLQPNSILSYTTKLQKLSVLATGHLYKNSDFLMDTDKIIGIISSNVKKSAKDYYAAIVKLLKSKKDIPTSVITTYSDVMKHEKTTEDLQRGDNNLSEKHKTRLTGLTLDIIKKRIIDYKPSNDIEMVYQLICAFYWLNAFTPRNDLLTFKLRASNNKKPYNPEFNYIVINAELVPKKIVMLSYKTSKTYGRQEFNISPELGKYLHGYLLEYKKQPGDFVFVDKHNTQFKVSNFSNLILKASQSVIGADLNVDLIRQYKLTNIFNSNPNMTINDRNELARNYLHSSETALEYARPAMLATGGDAVKKTVMEMF